MGFSSRHSELLQLPNPVRGGGGGGKGFLLDPLFARLVSYIRVRHALKPALDKQSECKTRAKMIKKGNLHFF